MKIVNPKNIGYVSGAQVSPDHASKIIHTKNNDAVI